MNTDFLADINWLAVIAATFAYFLLGALWYSKALFANPWIRDTKIDVNDPNLRKGMAGIMVTSFILMLITCIGLAILAERIGLYYWMSGVKLGLVTGICFGLTAISVSYLYEKRSSTLHWINGGYTVLGHIIAATIICAWP
jgi:hypothetical protein